jgi:hypothetical protein
MIPPYLISHTWIHFILLIIYLTVALICPQVCWFRMSPGVRRNGLLLLNNADY